MVTSIPLAINPKATAKENDEISTQAGPSRVEGVSPEGEHPEKAAEHVLPLRNPRDRFDVQWMHAEQGRDHGAAPYRPGHSPQSDEQQQHVRHVHSHVDPMMHGRAGTERVDVEP
jgi:hypothetical protein